MNFEEIFFRIGLTFLLALAYGIQRQLTLKATSFGTFTFVATGACGLAIAAIILSKKNPLPLLSAIVTGIGFLGAGALIRTGDRVSGFTSAASIWIFAIFGVLIGTGRYKIGISIYMIVWVIILIDKYLQYRGIGSYQKKNDTSYINTIHN